MRTAGVSPRSTAACKARSRSAISRRSISRSMKLHGVGEDRHLLGNLLDHLDEALVPPVALPEPLEVEEGVFEDAEHVAVAGG